MLRKIKIISTGCYMPPNRVPSTELDLKLNKPQGYLEALTGVKSRAYVTTETASEMGAKAALAALQTANLSINDIDCIVATSGTMEQHIPCNAVLLKKQLDCIKNPIPAFDINATCLSFLFGLDVLADSIELGKYDKVLLISSEVASVGLNWKEHESCGLFGDGAAAVIIGKAQPHEKSCLLGSYFENYVEGADFTTITGGGSKNHPCKFTNIEEAIAASLFKMDGKKIFKLASKLLLPYMETLYKKTNTNINDIKLLIPHQASGAAMKLGAKKINFEDKYLYILPEYGNQVSVSIPMTLHVAIKENYIQRSDTVLLFGTGAGLTFGATIITY